jgi:hypothetical protein
MGFIRGVIAGVAMAAGAAAWYMSRAGSKFRDRYRVDRKLGQLGDEIETRTRDVRAKVNTQVADVRSKSTGSASEGFADTLDAVEAAAAEEAAEIAADVESKAAKVKRAAKSAASE